MPPKKSSASDAPSLFKDIHFSFSGTFGKTHSELAALVKKHGAGCGSSVSKQTTHLVVTAEDFEKNSTKVTAAMARDGVSIVTFEFVNESIAQGALANAADYKPNAKNAKADVNVTSVSSTKRKSMDDDGDTQADDDGKDDKNAQKAPPPKRAKLTKKEIAAAATATATATAAATPMAVTDNVKDTKATKKEVVAKKVTAKDKILNIPVDQIVPNRMNYKVYVDPEDGTIWDATLNQTNVDANNNKFYIIQLLQQITGRQYACFTRWGRVGVDGQNNMYFSSDLESAKKEFCKKFKDKSKNKWEDRDSFVPKKGVYTYLPRDYGEEEEEEEEEVADKVKGEAKKAKALEREPDSNLHPKVQGIVKMIFNQEMMNQQMQSLNYNTEKFPLGKLKKSTITDGYNALKQLALIVGSVNPDKEEIKRLTNQFYTVVPHDFGRNRPPLINNPAILKSKLELVESLSEIQIAQSIMKDSISRDADGNPINHLDSRFASLNLNNFTPLDHDNEEFKLICEYVKNTHGKTHHDYDLNVLDAFALERSSEPERFKEAGSDKMANRALLWHGSRLTNFVGILSQGLRIAPPEAPVTGYMFGKGVYFADCVSKSANYCFTNKQNNEALMLLCEVALGDLYECTTSDYFAAENSRTAGKTGTLGIGRQMPDPEKEKYLDDGTRVPCGPVISSNRASVLEYNEFIVYDVKQIKFRYLIKMDFRYKRF